MFFTWPLPRVLTSAVLGEGVGDNLSVVWNFWWTRAALASADQSLFWTEDLFAPIGTSLVAHTLTPLITVSGALLPWRADPLLVYNVALIATVFLNFAIGYAAAYSITRDRLSSIFAAIAFGGAPFLLARLYGHLNLLSAWGLPLLLVVTLRYERNASIMNAVAVAFAIGVVAYTDYYYLIFGSLLVALHLGLSYRLVRLDARTPTPRHRRALYVIGVLIALASAIIVWIHSTGGVDKTIVGVRLRMTDTFNPRVALGFLLAGALLVWRRPRITLETPRDPIDSGVWRLLPIVALTSVLLLSPILVAGLRLWLAGDYATQTYFWRSAPPGIDVATLLLGNPLGLASGVWTRSVLERLDINQMEGTAWLGLAPVVLFIFAIRRLRARSDVQAYLWIAGVFFIWSLGPYLRVLGSNTAFMLPQTFVRFIPVIANARIPGRAIVVVQLMIALIGAMALAASRQSPRGTAVAIIAVIAVTLDAWPSPHPFFPLERPPIYALLRSMPPGIVLELPLGIADGFTTRGTFDFRYLFHQTIHEHPQMGGAVSRLSPRTRAAFESDPIVGPILDLSEGLAPRVDSSTGVPCRNSLVCAVRYVVINPTGSAELKAFVAKSLRLRLVAQEAQRALYRVEAVPSCDCVSPLPGR